MDFIYSWVKDIVIFMVLTSVVMGLCGKSSYKKYISLISGIILVILVISPLLKVFQLNKTLDYYFTTNSLVAEAGDAKSLEEKFGEREEARESVIFAQVKEKIGSKVKELLAKENVETESIGITLEEDEASGSYGSLKSLDVKGVYSEEKGDGGKEAIQIDQIKIGDITIKKDGKEERETREFLSPIEISAKKILSDFYNLEADNINISIRE